ncbi:TrbG/VirB9 family P-type conjugative transfer protein [Parerythrobacter aestuarii]|uniref:TrbG/VirB9 family P-type conjugative transfer protein n=1 Tax=Parerythrobacter aestuarii TaxID=3020909 RepID=UPI0024DE3656|nr:TrbG/VirB9 family P-type conjugative transfer protein [Parerythrobacter aestuarii]
MNRAAIPAALAMLLAATPLAAQDSRLVEVEYDEARIFTIQGRTKVQATIQFGEDEAIENVAIGDSAAWQVTPNKRANLLFVKPLEPTASTNMTVVTNKRTYLFDLVASPKAKPLYILSFSYPEEEMEAAAQLAASGQANPVEMAAATDPYAVVDPAALNWEWQKTGDANLFPARAFDDGDATFLEWNEGVPVPAILVKDFEGTEGPVNFTVRGNTVVVDGVPREIILRSGEEIATLVNTGPTRQEKLPSQASLGGEQQKKR